MSSSLAYAAYCMIYEGAQTGGKQALDRGRKLAQEWRPNRHGFF